MGVCGCAGDTKIFFKQEIKHLALKQHGTCQKSKKKNSVLKVNLSEAKLKMAPCKAGHTPVLLAVKNEYQKLLYNWVQFTP